MKEVKNSKVSTVRVGFDDRVHKNFRGPLAKERFQNELRALRHLKKQDCKFVPSVLEVYPDELYLVTTNCGGRPPRLSREKQAELFQELEHYDVRHNDRAERNITYNQKIGRFCLIDFEFATILSTGEGLEIADAEKEKGRLMAKKHLNIQNWK